LAGWLEHKQQSGWFLSTSAFNDLEVLTDYGLNLRGKVLFASRVIGETDNYHAARCEHCGISSQKTSHIARYVASTARNVHQ
jgi:hypothetical protein